MRLHRIAPALLLLLTSSLAQGAPTFGSDHRPSRERPVATERADEQHARDWGLKLEEWTRYRDLMLGPLGVYSPHIDPLTALGIEARTDQERQRYAELQVAAEAHHDHLIDVETGKVVEFVDPELEALQKIIAERLGYRLVDHRMELYGVAIDRKE